METKALLDIYESLLRAYGPQNWWPGDGPLEIILGAILTQRTTWENAAKALGRLREAGLCSLQALDAASEAAVEEAVRPSGCYRAKAKKLKAFVCRVSERFRGDLQRLLDLPMDTLRSELLAIHGIGPETADAIALYAAGRPAFVVDAYMRRLLERLGLLHGGESYDEIRDALMAVLPADATLFNEYHALIVRHGKVRCRPTPRCEGCPLQEACTYAGADK